MLTPELVLLRKFCLLFFPLAFGWGLWHGRPLYALTLALLLMSILSAAYGGTFAFARSIQLDSRRHQLLVHAFWAIVSVLAFLCAVAMPEASFDLLGRMAYINLVVGVVPFLIKDEIEETRRRRETKATDES